MAVVATPAVASACSGADLTPGASVQPSAGSAVVCLVNLERSKRSLAPLRDSSTLRGAAGRYASQMVAGGFFDHVSPTGSTLRARIAGVGYLKRPGYAIGENIGTGSGDLATPAAIVAAWMASPGHRRNILAREFRDVGIGVAAGMAGAGDGATYVADFGRRR